MAGALRHRAAAAVAATIRDSFPADRTLRGFSALTAPRSPPAATTTGRPSATATSFPTAAALRRNHQAATLEQLQGLETRVQRLEVDIPNNLLKVELQLKKDAVEAYDKYLVGQEALSDRVLKVNDRLLAERLRNVIREANSSAENARAVMQVGKSSWRVVVTVVGGAASTAFAVTQLVRADTKSEQATVAGEIVSKKTSQLEEQFVSSLQATVERAVDAAIAKEARRKSCAEEEAKIAFDARVGEALNSLDEKIARAVESSFAKHSASFKAGPEAKGRGPRA